MKKEDIQAFSYRITQANRTELVVITYDMAIRYIEDALAADDVSDYRDNLRMAKRVMDELVTALNMDYEISSQLFDVYMVIERYLIKAGSGASKDDFKAADRVKLLESCVRMLGLLKDAFDKLAADDKSAPLMQNTQQVYAGLTYSSAGGARESYTSEITNRGYRV